MAGWVNPDWLNSFGTYTAATVLNTTTAESAMTDWDVDIAADEPRITLDEVNYLVKVCKKDRKLAAIVDKLFIDTTEILIEF